MWRDGIANHVDQLVSNVVFENRKKIFPINTPLNKEQYWYRSLFHHHFGSDAAALTVPFNLSIACSTEKALEWDESFKKNIDESGRAVLGIHMKSECLIGTFI